MQFGFLAGLIPGVINGTRKGLQYEMDGLRLLIYALEHNDPSLRDDMLAVAKQQVAEGVDGLGVVKSGVVTDILNDKDPFSTSRHMMQDLETKHGITYDAKGHLVLPK